MTTSTQTPAPPKSGFNLRTPWNSAPRAARWGVVALCAAVAYPVSYTHLTLPTIYSV